MIQWTTGSRESGPVFPQVYPQSGLGGNRFPSSIIVDAAGMMDTVLNLGLNDQTVEALAKKSGDRRFAFDSYRRFVQMYSDVVLGIEINHFEKHLDRAKEKRGVKQDKI